MSQVPYNSLLHRTAQLTCVATLLLIFMGGLVTSHQAGMSVPDWPNSYGYNMFTFPISKWVGGIFYEHTHRLMGTVVGMLSIALVIIAWKVESRRWVRWLAASVLGAVIFQGVLGGLRVVLVKLDLAIVHACVAQAFFCFTALLAVVTSRWWISTQSISSSDKPHRDILIPLAFSCVIAIYVQLVVGATMRHYGAGLAIPDFPLSYGKLIPPTSSRELDEVISGAKPDAQGFIHGWNSEYLTWDTFGATIGKVWLNFGHRVGALVVVILGVITAAAAIRRGPGLRWLGITIIFLLASQITLGTLTVLLHKPADIASLHVATGALTLMTTFVLLIRSMRLYSPRWRNVSRGFELQTGPIHSMVPA